MRAGSTWRAGSERRVWAGWARAVRVGGAEDLHDVGEVGGGDDDVGVVDEEVGVPGVREKLDQGGDFAGCAEVFGAHDEAEIDVGVTGGEVGDDGDGGVVWGADAAEDLEGAGVLLEAMGCEGGGEGVIRAAEGFEERDAGGCGVVCEGGALMAEVVGEAARSEEGEGGVDEAADGEEREGELDEMGQQHGASLASYVPPLGGAR